MKETHMTFRIEPQLRDAFAAAAARAHEPASQVLRRFMRDYVQHQEATDTQNDLHQPKALTQRERAESVRSGEAIWGLEGFVKTPAMRIVDEAYISGRLSVEAQGELVRFRGRLVGAACVLRQLPADDTLRAVMEERLVVQTAEFRELANTIHPALFETYGDL
jgi:hypothetical protein